MSGPSINADTYRARAVTAALGFTNGGKPQVAIDFVLLDGGYLSQMDSAIGTHITWYGYFTEKSTEHTMKALRTCGWSTDSLDDLTGVDEKEVSLVLVEELDQQGYTRIKVRWINAPGGGGVALKARMAPDEARSFAEQMRGYAQASRATAPPAAAPARQAAAPARAAARAPAAPPARGAYGSTAQARAAVAPEPAPLDDDNIPF